ncbi:MAG TPA: 2OG-Fe(II) oxygenase family protein [Caulobacteraceae bacterium]|jgi:Rps23 Pro-64 3,4-dihydroxylase Tpa1-like proline 4-hydroxylase|nr:2OG-Fe(II) oxygenase family protein [Caulobacteraceae bacterium]
MTEPATVEDDVGGIALSPDLDLDALKQVWARDGRLHIANVLAPPCAERIARALETRTVWSLTANAAGEVFEMPLDRLAELDPAERARIEAITADGSLERMQYLYETWRVSFFVDHGMREGGAVEDLYDFLNGEAFLGFVRELTGDERAAFSDAQATRYRPGHFLTTHDDTSAGRHRLCAYVLNFTRRWRPDWGGLLQFYDESGNVEAGFTPAFNALNLFSVPRAHAVSYVAPFAQGERLSVTGWVRARPTE